MNSEKKQSNPGKKKQSNQILKIKLCIFSESNQIK